MLHWKRDPTAGIRAYPGIVSQIKQGESNEIQKVICCGLRVARRACAVAAGMVAGRYPNHHNYNTDSGRSAANQNHSDDPGQNEGHASQEGEDGEANDEDNYESVPGEAD